MKRDEIPQQRIDQANLLDALLRSLRLRNDAALCRRLNVAQPNISKIRRHKLPVGASMLIRMHEEAGISIKELRALMGDHRPFFRPISLQTLQRHLP